MENANPTEESEIVDSAAERVNSHPFVELLGNRTVVKVFVALLDAPHPLNPNDIAETADISRNAWYENKDVLEEYGVIEQTGTAGNSPLYQLTADDELVATLKKTADVAGARRRDD